MLQPLYGLFWGEHGNGVWKRNADSAFHHCKTFKSLMEETMSAIPDSVLDSPVADAYSTTCIDKFADSKNLLPSPYTVEEEEKQLLYA
ncbi:putative tRNA-dihydrouridine(20/20a) synthase [Helianthus annuus]|nr:putative tRNA-dihydrouridine(20/20a) synthase [Helianthus annuus]